MYFKPELNVEECKKWKANKYINPRSGRVIGENGVPFRELKKMYNKYVKEGKIKEEEKHDDEDDKPLKKHDEVYVKRAKGKKKKQMHVPTEIDKTCKNYDILTNDLYVKENKLKDFQGWKPTHEESKSSNENQITCEYSDEHIKGREKKFYCYMDTYDSIDKNKFIMLKNRKCYDIEVLLNHIIKSYQKNKPRNDPGNIDPETNDKIWENKDDIRIILKHPLIKDQSIINDKDWAYTKKTFVKNVKTFKTKVVKNKLLDKMYLKMFDEHIDLLLNINRLGTIFHTDQPSNYFDPAKIVFKDLGDLDNTKIDEITKKLIDVINTQFKRELNNIEKPERLRHEIIDIFTDHYGSKIYDDITKDFEHSFEDRINILENVSYMYGLSLNFKESIKAKEDFHKYTTTFNEKERKLIKKLIGKQLNSNGCIHGIGLTLKGIFMKYWFMYLESKGMTKYDISLYKIPKTYGDELNEKMVIKSSLLKGDSYAEEERGYSFTYTGSTPYWVSKMGKTYTFDGISLVDYYESKRRSFRF